MALITNPQEFTFSVFFFTTLQPLVEVLVNV